MLFSLNHLFIYFFKSNFQRCHSSKIPIFLKHKAIKRKASCTPSLVKKQKIQNQTFDKEDGSSSNHIPQQAPFDQKLVKFLVSNMIPLSLVEDNDFREFVNCK